MLLNNGPSSSPKVVVVGGTHGNEYTGVWCVRALAKEPRCSTLIGNPAAVAANVRFLEDDLNRQFKASQLHLPPATHEARRAHELNQLLGPKESPQTDLIVDIHSTTCNMGLTLIIAEGDILMAKLAAYIAIRVPRDDQGRKTRIVIHAIPDRMERSNLGSIAKHNLTIEVGPVPQGLMRHDAAEITLRAVLATLDYLEQPSPDSSLPKYVMCFRSAPAVVPGEIDGKIPWPVPPVSDTVLQGFPTPNIPSYIVHKDRQDRDFELVRKGDPLFVYHDGTVIPYSGSHGDEVYLIFINGAGYYYAKSGTGISVAEKLGFEVATATFVNDMEVDWIE